MSLPFVTNITKIRQNFNQSIPAGWRILIITLLILGIFFRFYNLERKVYWHDESYTSLFISGYTGVELGRQIFNSKIIGIEEIQKHQQPRAEIGVVEAVKTLAIADPQHPPLYYAIARLWVQWFGNSVWVIRSLSVAISLLVFPCIYWLCRELFELPLTRWMAIALAAISPFHLIYAQEAREYILWIVTILVSHAALLQAMRLKTNLSWAIYAVTVSLGLYTYIFSVLVMLAHGIYVFASDRLRLTKTFISYLLATLAGCLTFVPWLVVLIDGLSHAKNSTSWTSGKMALTSLIKIWVGNITRIFFDVNLDTNSPFIYKLLPSLAALILVVLLSIAVTSLALILPDLILGGRRSAINRYQIPCYLGIGLAVAHLLASQISRQRSPKIWKAIAAIIITAGVISCTVSSQSDTWWNKKNSHHNPEVARIINQTSQPLLISTNYRANQGEILSLSYLLDPKTKLLLASEPLPPQIPNGFSDVFLFNPSKGFRTTMETQQKQKIVPVGASDFRLWKLTK
jgi:uncharacterized membrane protein